MCTIKNVFPNLWISIFPFLFSIFFFLFFLVSSGTCLRYLDFPIYCVTTHTHFNEIFINNQKRRRKVFHIRWSYYMVAQWRKIEFIYRKILTSEAEKLRLRIRKWRGRRNIKKNWHWRFYVNCFSFFIYFFSPLLYKLNVLSILNENLRMLQT